MIEQVSEDFHLVGRRHRRKRRAPGFPVVGVDGSGAGAAITTAEVVRADDEIFVGIDGFAGPDHGFPPAFVHFWLPKFADAIDARIEAHGVMGAGQGVEEENRIRAVGIERSPSFVGERDSRQLSAVAQLHRLGGAADLKILGADLGGHARSLDPARPPRQGRAKMLARIGNHDAFAARFGATTEGQTFNHDFSAKVSSAYGGRGEHAPSRVPWRALAAWTARMTIQAVLSYRRPFSARALKTPREGAWAPRRGRTKDKGKYAIICLSLYSVVRR
jgi:hypothetical protein